MKLGVLLGGGVPQGSVWPTSCNQIKSGAAVRAISTSGVLPIANQTHDKARFSANAACIDWGTGRASETAGIFCIV